METIKGSQEQLLTVEQLARILSVPVSWCYEKVRNGASTVQIPCLRIGRYVRFHLPAVMEWLEKTQGLKQKEREEKGSLGG